MKLWLGRLWSRCVAWLRQRPWASRRALYRVVRVEAEPNRLQPNCVYVVGEGDHVWQASLLCPCGCGETISLDLLQDSSPCWKLSEVENLTTLRPSIRRVVGCRSHFFLRRGRIEWCDMR